MTALLDLDALEKLCEAATPGPWFAVNGRGKERLVDPSDGFQAVNQCWTFSDNPKEPGWETDSGTPFYGVSKAIAEFCATAREAVPLLIAEVRRLRDEVVEAQRYDHDRAHENEKLRAENEALRKEMNEQRPYRDLWEAAEDELGKLRQQVASLKAELVLAAEGANG